MADFHLNRSPLRICVDRAGDGIVSGRVLSRRLTRPVVFSELTDLALKMDAVFDAQDHPQAYQSVRGPVGSKTPPQYAADPLSGGMSLRQVSEGRGAAATFEILVVSRRSSTWQGALDRLDGSPPQEFRSFLELLRLIHRLLFGC